MGDQGEVEESPARGNEWEVVSLTASAYTAAPGPEGFEQDKDNTNKDDNAEEEVPETSCAMFLSGHFVFPPSQHENLLLESEPKGTNIHDVVPDLDADEKEFNEDTGLQGLDLVHGEQYVYGESETSIGGSTIGGSTDEKAIIHDLIEPPGKGFDFADITQSPKFREDDHCHGSHLPREAWWKRRAISLYARAKEVNSFWSICISAAVMGVVILGHRWHHGRLRISQLKWQFTVGDAKASKVVGPLSGFKDVIVGGHQHGSSIKASGSTC